MKITVEYSERSYGTGEFTSDYRAHIEKSVHTISVGFYFNDYLVGRGWGENVGTVHGASLELSHDESRKLALAMLHLLENGKNASQVLYFGLANSSPVDAFKRMLKSTSEPAKQFVLSTFDGRTLQHGFLGVVPDPSHYSEIQAKMAADRWNRSRAKYDQVTPAPWREHYARMIDLLEQPCSD